MVSVYVSYAWKEEEQNRLVDKLGAACTARGGIELVRDIGHIGYGDSIQAFMDRLAVAEHIVLVVSDSYLRSRYCMYELREIWRNGRFRERVSPVILRGTADPEEWVQYLEHWEGKKKRLADRLSKIDREYTSRLNQFVDAYADFRRLMVDWLMTLCDMNALSPDVHLASDFAALLDRVLAGKTAATSQGLVLQRESDEQFVARVEEEVRDILCALPSFASVVRAQAKRQRVLQADDELAHCLCCGKLENVLSDVLRPATESALPRRSAEIMCKSDVWEAAKSLVAWLSVLAVRPEWVQKREQLDMDGESAFEIFVKTECGVEIVSSRYRQIRPRFGPIKGFDVRGDERLDLPVVETGWDDPYAVQQILLGIAKQFFPESFNPGTTQRLGDDELIENLKETLSERAKHKSHHHYMLITASDNTPLQRPDFYRKLVRELPALAVIYMRSSGAQTPLVVEKESRLITIIREFLTIPELLARKR